MVNRKRMKWTAAATMVLTMSMVVLNGCSGFMEDSRAEAQEDWNRVRAEAICQQAEEHLRVGQLVKACKLANDAIMLSPDYAEAHIVLACALIERGQYTAAATELELVMRKNADCVEALYLLGVAYEKDGRLQDALRCYEDSYNLDRDHYESVLAATEILVQMNELGAARRYLNRHQDQADGNAAAYELAGRLARMDEDYEAAAIAYLRAFELDVLNINYLEELAVAQVLSGQHVAGIESLELRTRRADVAAPRWVWTMLGDCYLKYDYFEEAQNAFSHASKLAPDDPASWVDLSKAYAKAGDMQVASEYAAKALAVDPAYLDACLLAGYSLLELDRASEAVAVLRRALRRDPENCVALCLMGHAQRADGNTTEAERCFQKAEDIDPNHPLLWALRKPEPVHTASVMR